MSVGSSRSCIDDEQFYTNPINQYLFYELNSSVHKYSNGMSTVYTATEYPKNCVLRHLKVDLVLVYTIVALNFLARFATGK